MTKNNFFSKVPVIFYSLLHFMVIGITHYTIGTKLYIKTEDIFKSTKNSDITFDLLDFREIQVSYICICIVLLLITISLLNLWRINKNPKALITFALYSVTFVVHLIPLLWMYTFKQISDRYIVSVMLKLSNILVSIPNFNNQGWYIVLFAYYSLLLLAITIYVWDKPDKILLK